MKTLRYDPKSIRSGLTLVTLLCWILPILIIVTMFSVLVNYYNDRNLEQAMDLGMENASDAEVFAEIRKRKDNF